MFKIHDFFGTLVTLFDKTVLLQVCMRATEEIFSFLFIELTSPTIDDMFFVKFDKRLMIHDA